MLYYERKEYSKAIEEFSFAINQKLDSVSVYGPLVGLEGVIVERIKDRNKIDSLRRLVHVAG
jgi:hypothetical protein